MKIIFICGSMEPGRDGVGDYTQRLACELIRQGHHTAAVALYDKHTTEELSDELMSDGVKFPVLRIPAVWSVKARFERAKEWIDDFKPEWISLQFVPYSFNSKGLPFMLSKNLTSLSKDYCWHIMFHELWLDASERVSHQIIGLMQQFIIKGLLNKLKPRVINVSISYNQKRLEEIGKKSDLLNLFGNIPLTPLGAKETPLEGLTADDTTKILYFGGAPRGKYLKQVVDGIVGVCKRTTEKIKIIVVSGNSNAKDEFIFNLKANIAKYDAKVIDLGFVEADTLSIILSNCTVGIARSEPFLLGKSGSAIAMLEHGLPVWMPKWTNTNEPVEVNFRTELIYSDLNDAINSRDKPKYNSLLPCVAKELIHQLSK